MNKLAWTFFGAVLTALLALGGFALDLMPSPAGAERPAKIVVTFDNEVEALRADLANLRLERDRLAADLKAAEVEQDTLLEDLSFALAERNQLRQRLGLDGASIADADGGQPGAADRLLVPEAGPAAVALAAPANLLGIGLQAYRSQDYTRAFQSWLPLAQAGNPRAQFFLGGLYNDGAGVAPDRVQAYIWLRRSDLGGNRRAETLLATIIPQMTPAEIQRAESQVAGATFQ